MTSIGGPKQLYTFSMFIKHNLKQNVSLALTCNRYLHQLILPMTPDEKAQVKFYVHPGGGTKKFFPGFQGMLLGGGAV